MSEAGEIAQATREVLIAVETYDSEGWRHPPELEALLQSDWYDPSFASFEPTHFYAQHADDALTLCFDEVRDYPATYLGTIEGRDGKKPRPCFAFRPDDAAVSILGRRGARILKTLKPGSPVTLLVGIEAQRRDVLEVLPRPDGVHWDCAEANEGVISWRSADGTSITAYCGREREIRFPLAACPVLSAAALGSGVRVRGATNPSNDRFEAYCIELALVPQHADIGVFRGALRRASKGFGFIEDVFVPASLLEAGLQATQEYEVVAVQSFDKSKERYGWRAVAISSC